jgi:uncharacterized OsmC-like protein
MKIRARLENQKGLHQVTLATEGNAHSLTIPPKSTGFGSSVNGGELLFLALATCYCNDIYREAAKRGIRVEDVKVVVAGEFGAEGEPAKNVTYRARVASQASEELIRDLMERTDQMAEIQNTLLAGIPVHLSQLEIVPLL